MGGTLAVKSVRHAFDVLAEIREAKRQPRKAAGSRQGAGTEKSLSLVNGEGREA
jgi:hypothetical protein